jgi:hypothetical protein
MTTYTPTLKLALPVSGQLSGQWGNVVNDSITSLVEQAVAGIATINTWGNNAHTLTTADGATAEARCAMLVFTDTNTVLTGAATVICPTAAKLYVVKNSTGQTATIKTAAGTGVAVANGGIMFVFCDGTNVVQALTNITGATISGATIADGTFTGATVASDNLTFSSSYTETVFALTGATPALSPDNGTIQTWTLPGNSTPTVGNWTAGQSLTLMVDDGTAYAITWSSVGVVWKTDSAGPPLLSTTSETVIQLWKVGSTIYGARVGDS